MRRLTALAIVLALSWAAGPVCADQRRDWMLEGLGTGDRLLLDYFGTGAQVRLEHRRQFYGHANDYAFSVGSLIAYPGGQLTMDASLRVLFLEISGTFGYRTVWRNLSFEPGDHGEYCKDCDRPARRARDPILGSGPDTDRYVMAEGRIQLYAPMNEYVVGTSLLGVRYEGLRPRSYDWFFTDIHDPGVITRWENMLFFKHRRWGGIGPYTLMQWLPRAGRHVGEFAYGFNVVTRLGLLERNDLLFFTFLMRPGDGYYGQHSYYAPFRTLLVYRIALSL